MLNDCVSKPSEILEALGKEAEVISNLNDRVELLGNRLQSVLLHERDRENNNKSPKGLRFETTLANDIDEKNDLLIGISLKIEDFIARLAL